MNSFYNYKLSVEKVKITTPRRASKVICSSGVAGVDQLPRHFIIGHKATLIFHANIRTTNLPRLMLVI